MVTHLHLDHAVEAVRVKTLSRSAAFAAAADPLVTGKFEQTSGAANGGGTWHWLGRLDRPAS